MASLTIDELDQAQENVMDLAVMESASDSPREIKAGNKFDNPDNINHYTCGLSYTMYMLAFSYHSQ